MLLCLDIDEASNLEEALYIPSKSKYTKMLILEVSMLLLFCGPHTGTQYGQLERCDRGYKIPSAS